MTATIHSLRPFSERMLMAQFKASKALETDGPNAVEILREAARFFERQMVELDRQADEIERDTASLPQRTRTLSDVLGADVVARAMAYGDDDPTATALTHGA